MNGSGCFYKLKNSVSNLRLIYLLELLSIVGLCHASAGAGNASIKLNPYLVIVMDIITASVLFKLKFRKIEIYFAKMKLFYTQFKPKINIYSKNSLNKNIHFILYIVLFMRN